MEYLPLFHNLNDQHCLVVGGGQTALRKVTLLLRAGAIVTVVAPSIDPELEALLQTSGGKCQFREFIPADLEVITLVIAATNDTTVNSQVAELAKSRLLPVNVVDQPALCSFIFPSIVDRSPVIVAVSSSGRLPVLARFIRAQIETILPGGLGRFAEFAAGYRDAVKQKFPQLGSVVTSGKTF